MRRSSIFLLSMMLMQAVITMQPIPNRIIVRLKPGESCQKKSPRYPHQCSVKAVGKINVAICAQNQSSCGHGVPGEE